MEAFKQRLSGIRTRLESRISDLNSVVKYFKINAEYFEKYDHDCIGISGKINRHLEYLSFLRNIIETDFLGSDHYFGLEVLLSELDVLFTECIDPLKESLGLLLNSEGRSRTNIAELFSIFGEEIGKNTFIKIKSTKIKSVTKTFIVDNLEIFSDENFDILDEYLSVGKTLENDEVTQRLLEQITRLANTNNGGISMYSAIIGPSFMGKTQTAFTLSCIINVIYVNFIPTCTQGPIIKLQKIYELFKGIEEIFKMVIYKDETKLKRAKLDTTAESIKNSKLSFKTLGLIYVLLRTRKIREAQCTQNQVFSVRDWLIEIVNINSAIIPSMTISQFRKKTEGNC